jgi:hypothetical protein
MCRVDERYPGFGFSENVGYSTPEHRAAILQHGPCDLHRRSFQSIAYSQLALEDPEAAEAALLAAEAEALEESHGALEGAPDVRPADDAARAVEG